MTKYQEYPDGQPQPRGLGTITREKRKVHVRNAHLKASAPDVIEFEQHQDQVAAKQARTAINMALEENAGGVVLSKHQGSAPTRVRSRKPKDSIIISVPEDRLNEALPILRSLQKRHEIQAPKSDFMRSSRMKADENGIVHISVLGRITDSMVERLNGVGAVVAEDDKNKAEKTLKGTRRAGHLSGLHGVIGDAAHDLVIDANLSPEKAASLFSAKRGNQIVTQIRDWKDAPETVSVHSFDTLDI